MTEVIVAAIAILSAPLAATVTWRLSKRKNLAEVDSTVVRAASVSVETMLQVVAQLRLDIAELTEENRILREETAKLHREVQRLTRLVRDLGGST